jgi:hypothetical protein
LIRGMRDSGAAATGEGQGELDMRRVRERVLAKGFTAQQLEACLDEYAQLDVSLSCAMMMDSCVHFTDNHPTDLANGSRRHPPRLHRGRRRRVRHGRRRFLRKGGNSAFVLCTVAFGLIEIPEWL